jgi:hypothetical protein
VLVGLIGAREALLLSGAVPLLIGVVALLSIAEPTPGRAVPAQQEG